MNEQRLRDLLTVEAAGKLPPDMQADLDTLRAAGALPATSEPPSFRSRAADVVRTLRPTSTAVGGFLGGLAGAGGGLPTGPGAIMTGVAGAGLGAGFGGTANDLVESLVRGDASLDLPTTDQLGQRMLRAGQDVTAGAEGEMGGQVLGKLVGSGVSALRSRWNAAHPDAEGLVQAAARQDIPLAGSDVSQSVTARRIENFPSYFAIGSGKVQAFREGQVAATEGAARRVVDSLADAQADAVTAGLKAQGGARAAVQEFRRQSGQLFEQINQLAGDQPIVGTTNLSSMADSLVSAGEQTGLGTVSQAAKLQGLGLSESSAQALEAAGAGGKIPFAVARQIEAELGDLAFRGPTIGGPRAGQLKALYSAVRQDLDEFLTSEAGNEIAPALAEAKQVYSTGKQLFNGSARRLILGGRNSPLAPEQVVNRVFRPGQIDPTVEFKLLVDDETYGQATQAWLDGIISKATTEGKFSPAKFATEIAKYEKNGHLDVILPPQAAAQVRDVARVAQAMTRSNTLAKNPSGTTQAGTSVAQIMLPLLQAAGGDPGGALKATAMEFLAPIFAGRAAFSPTGREILGGGLPSALEQLGPQTLRGVGHGAAAMGNR